MSALIFVALAIAWAVYLVPKALRHQEEIAANRKVEEFSDRVRVVASREPVSPRRARLVTPGRPAVEAEVAASGAEAVAALTPAQVRGRRAAAALAARRRLRVVCVILLGLLTVGVLALAGVMAPAWIAVPGVVLAAWLVACRLMVRGERSRLATPARTAVAAAGPVTTTHESADAAAAPESAALANQAPDDVTEEFTAVAAQAGVDADLSAQPVADGWDPVPATLPTYVSKEQAPRRSVRTIDLDSTGVWTSGRTVADAALAKEADEAARAERSDRRRAAGS